MYQYMNMCFVYAHVYIHVHIYIYIYVFIHIHVYLYIYKYMFTFICIFTYIYTYLRTPHLCPLCRCTNEAVVLLLHLVYLHFAAPVASLFPPVLRPAHLRLILVLLVPVWPILCLCSRVHLLLSIHCHTLSCLLRWLC